MEEKQTSKLKPARSYRSRPKIAEVQDMLQDITPSLVYSSGIKSPAVVDAHSDAEADVMIPAGQPEVQPQVAPQAEKLADNPMSQSFDGISKQDLLLLIETALITTLDNREAAQRKAKEQRIRELEESGADVFTTENGIKKCVEYIESIEKDYNLYKTQSAAISQEREQTSEIIKQQNATASRLETIIGRIEDVQGVKAPKRPPFPSFACLAFLLWHWPMYVFASLWLSKYFRRLCFLLTFVVMVVQFCLICLLAYDNRSMHYDHSKYVTVRNWTYVLGDTAALGRFKYVDGIYNDVDFNKAKIDELHELIRLKHETMMMQYK